MSASGMKRNCTEWGTVTSMVTIPNSGITKPDGQGAPGQGRGLFRRPPRTGAPPSPPSPRGRGREHRASHSGTGAHSAGQQRPKQRCPGDVPPPHALPPGPARLPNLRGGTGGTGGRRPVRGASPAGRRQPGTEVVSVHRRPSVRVTGSGSRRGLRGASSGAGAAPRSLGWKRDAPQSGRRPPGQRGGAGSRWTRRRQNRNRNPARPAAAASSARRPSSREAWTGRRPRPGTAARRPDALDDREPPPSRRGGAARRGRAGRGRDGRRKAALRPASAPRRWGGEEGTATRPGTWGRASPAPGGPRGGGGCGPERPAAPDRGGSRRRLLPARPSSSLLPGGLPSASAGPGDLRSGPRRAPWPRGRPRCRPAARSRPRSSLSEPGLGPGPVRCQLGRSRTSRHGPMSGSQPTTTDRFPLKKPIRHGSILNRESPADKKQRVERSASHDFDPTDSSSKKTKSSSEESRSEIYGLVQRCVIIQKGDNGFGLTVSGDNPVFVQSVKEDGAAMRAGVQTGDRIIKVNGTLVTHSNHLEVVKLIKSGSYVALTVQGRPPGMPQIPLADSEGEPSVTGHMSPLMTSPHSPGASGNMERITSPVLMGEENSVVHNQKVEILRKMLQKEQERLQLLQEDYNRAPTPKLLKEIQEAKKLLPQLQEQLSKAAGPAQDGAVLTSSKPCSDTHTVSEVEADPDDGLGRVDCSSGDASWPSSDNAESPKSGLKEGVYLEENLEKNEVIQDTDAQSLIGSPAARTAPHIIGAEDDDFGTEHEQINGQCSCFQSIELLKSRPAHLAVFLHHVVSQFDPATLLCYLYSDLYKQTNSKETRRIFLEFHQFFLDRSAHLKVSVPDEISIDLEKRRPELIPEDLHRHYIHTMQERVHPEIQRHLEDFRQKRSMGLTLAESELTKLDVERDKDRVTLEKERACAEQIVAKIEEVLMTAQAIEEDKSSAAQYVILMYMKHLGVRVKEPRSLEQKRGRIGFLPKIKQSMKKEREGDEKGKRRGFSSILGPPRRPSRPDNSAIGRAMELQKPRHPKHSPPPPPVSPEPQDAAKSRQSGPASDGADAGCLPAGSVSSASAATLSQDGGKENDTGSKPAAESPASADLADAPPRASSAALEFVPPPLDQLQEEEWEAERMTEHGTPKPFRKVDSIAFGESQSEDEQFDHDLETDPPSWQQLVSREVLLGLKPCEIKRQEVINELFYTERAHVRTLKVLDQVFYQRVCREGILSPSELRKIFSNLEDILQLHIGLNEQMKTVRKRNETSVIDQIGEDLLTWFSGPGEEKLKHAAATFCSNQPFALEMIKSRQKKDSRFQTFVQDAESNPLCRRLQLKDIIPTQMQRLTKYPLLLDNIAKYTEWPTEREKVKKAADHCRQILNYVNQAVKEAENKQRLEDYQRRLDTSSLKLSEYPDVEELRNLDLTKRKMIHEGPLVWKVNRDKTIDLYTLLLEDILVLLQKQDDRLVLRCHSKILASTADSKHTFSPVIKLSTVLVRQVATDNKAFFVISMSDNGAQIYELVAQTVSEKTVWQDLICQMAASVKEPSTKPIPLPQSPPCEGDNDYSEPPKLKAEPHGVSVAGLQSPDRDLGLESPLLSSKPQSHPLGTTGKAEADELSVAERRFAQAQHAERAVKEAGVNDQITTSDPYVPVSEERWALDALRNLGLLKQLLAQKLSLAEKSAQEDWPRFSRCRMAFPGMQADSETQNFEMMKACPAQRQTPLRAGAGGLSACSSPRASADSPPPRDPMVPAFQEGQAGSAAVTGRTPVPLEAPPAEPEGGLDESGEHFFDAHEVHSDDDPSEGEGAVKQEEKDVAAHISGNYLILDGWDAAPESSTEEEGAAWRPPQPRTGPAVDPAPPQRPASRKALSDGARSPLSPEPLAPQRRGALEGACLEARRPPACTDSQSQVLGCIRQIEAALEHLKKVEESYTILCQRLAGSALTDKHADKS